MPTPPSAPWIVRLSVSVYRGIIYGIGPTSYFRPYGDLTIQLFRECCQDAYRQRGILGVLSLWLPSFRDAVAQMVVEFLCERQYTSQPHVSVGTVSALAFEYFSAPIDFMRKHTRPLARQLRRLRRELSEPFFRASLLKSPTNIRFEQQLHHWRGPDSQRGPRGRSSPYESGVEIRGFQGMPGAFLRSKVRAASEIQRCGLRSMLTQAIKAGDYRGKHVRFSGDVKVEHVEPQAGLMVAIFFPPPRKLAERWRQGRPERSIQEKWGEGTHDWMRYETTIFVPENAQYIHFGVIMHGTGQIWLANARLEVIEQDGMLSA